jgi:FkbM family methyltransferase
MIKKIVQVVYFWYNSHFPIKRGKQFLAKLLSRYYGSFIVKSKSGVWLDIYLKSPQDMHLISLKKDESSDQILKSIAELKQGDTFVDIGANIGYYSILASQEIGQSGMAYSFEPSFREYRRLLNGILLNGVTNIMPFNFAISDFCGHNNFLIESDHTGMNKLNISTLTNSLSITVPTFSFDSIVINQCIEKIDLMKIDVEGAEFLVLSGMKETLAARKVKVIVVEITPKFLNEFGHNKDQIYSLMESFGFSPIVNSKEWQFDEIFVLDK